MSWLTVLYNQILQGKSQEVGVILRLQITVCCQAMADQILLMFDDIPAMFIVSGHTFHYQSPFHARDT